MKPLTLFYEMDSSAVRSALRDTVRTRCDIKVQQQEWGQKDCWAATLFSQHAHNVSPQINLPWKNLHSLSYSVRPARVVACPNQYGRTGMHVLWKISFNPLALALQEGNAMNFCFCFLGGQTIAQV